MHWHSKHIDGHYLNLRLEAQNLRAPNDALEKPDVGSEYGCQVIAIS